MTDKEFEQLIREIKEINENLAKINNELEDVLTLVRVKNIIESVG